MSKALKKSHQSETDHLKQDFVINGQSLKVLTEAGLTWLRTNQDLVNSLNVFPVPDGDTGTNMVLTMQSAYDEISNSPEDNVGKMAHGIAHGALMGARGNSGVILSQLWRGFARSLDEQSELNAYNLVEAFVEARDTAYKGVVRPVEGTILTVAKDIASAAKLALEETDNLREILTRVVSSANESVDRTPELLDVLKEAGVVDAGGKGLFYILEGMERHLQGLPLDVSEVSIKPLASLDLSDTLETIEPGQDFEVVVDFHPNESLDLEKIYQDLESMGTSIQMGEGDGIYRMHIHVPTDKRYEPIDYTMSLGTVTKVSIENLIAQIENIDQKPTEDKIKLSRVEPNQIAVVTVAPGPGIARVFASLGAAAIIEGGQTMNPSTQEIINSFENLPTDKIIILPNNKNIILAAEAAAGLTVKRVTVIPSKSVPQGLASMMCLIPDGDYDKLVKEMFTRLDEVETGEITTATRNVEIDGISVKKDEIIAMHNGKLVCSSDDLEQACMGLLEKAHADYYELITLFYGADLPKNEVYRISDAIRSRYTKQEIEVQEGGQPHYHFIISIE